MAVMIVECNVWCVNSKKELIEIGLPEGDRWMPFAIDFRKVVAIKLAGESDFLGDDKSVIYLNGDALTIDIPYMIALKVWRDALKQ